MSVPLDDPHALQLRREALTMGLYVSITLLAALTVTTHDDVPDEDVLAIVWGTTVGLALAHWFAFSVAAHLVQRHEAEHEPRDLLLAQLGAAFTVAIVASLPVILLPDGVDASGARFATAAVIAGAAFGQTRAFGGSRGRAASVAVVALVLGLVVAAVKYAVSH